MPAGEVCTEWRTWSEFFNVRFILAESLLQAFVYVALAVSRTSNIPSKEPLNFSHQVTFAGSAAVLVKTYAP